MDVCNFCFNAHVWAKLPHDEEDYFDGGLHDDNDGSSHGIGRASPQYKLDFNSGMGVACNIGVHRWQPDTGWIRVAEYFPKYCPECGRKLDEYHVNERGTDYIKEKKEFC